MLLTQHDLNQCRHNASHNGIRSLSKSMRSNTLALTWLTPLSGLLWSYFTVFLWIVDLEGMKQVCCVSRVSAREWSQIRQATCILLVTAPFSLTGTEVFPHFAFARCVLSLTEEVEHSSVAIFTVWCLVLVHEHTCLGMCDVAGLSINTVCMVIAYHSE